MSDERWSKSVTNAFRIPFKLAQRECFSMRAYLWAFSIAQKAYGQFSSWDCLWRRLVRSSFLISEHWSVGSTSITNLLCESHWWLRLLLSLLVCFVNDGHGKCVANIINLTVNSPPSNCMVVLEDRRVGVQTTTSKSQAPVIIKLELRFLLKAKISDPKWPLGIALVVRICGRLKALCRACSSLRSSLESVEHCEGFLVGWRGDVELL